MDKSGYGMAKFGVEAKAAVPKRDCGFYVKYVFLFTSLIQFLIILGLVLFMVYGNAHGGTDTHLQLLEQQMQERYNRIITLSGRNANLTRALNATAKERQALQLQLHKVQRELDKCNSSQGSGAGKELQEMMRMVFYQKTKLDECHMTVSLINASCQAEKATLRSQQDQAALARRELEERCGRASAALAAASRAGEGCQRELLTTRAGCDATRSRLELQQRECASLRDDVRYSFQRIKELLGPYSCSGAQEQLGWLAQRTEGLFLWQQERDAKYVGKTVCSMMVAQCQLNCSHDKQDLGKRLQEAEKRAQSGQEEQKKLLAAKELLAKELEEKSRAAAQAAYLKEQLGMCTGAKFGTFLDASGARAPVGTALGARPGAFGSAGTFTSADVLRSQGVLEGMGRINAEEIQRAVRRILEQYAPPNPSG
ncbi:plasmalemma vesicle-associated protein [Eudromia elegans]